MKVGQLTVYHLLGVIESMSPIVSLFLSRMIKTTLEIEIRSIYMNEYMIFIQLFNIQIVQQYQRLYEHDIYICIYMYRQGSNISRTLVGN